MPFMMLAMNAGLVAALWWGGRSVINTGLEVGELIAFINYLTQTLMSLMMISMLVVRFARAQASAERISELMNAMPEIPEPAAPQPARAGNRLAFENVSFSYDRDGRDPVLKNVSFVAEPGQTVALLGATGAGKSTLVNLIPRFYDVTGGRVTLDGVDVRELGESALRGAVGIALQESILFTGSIRDNIRYGRPDASDDEVIAAAKLAQAHDFIARFPD
ncbi:multidrug ABC transporter ATP-binding protein, partial [Kouleothrix aurantiaca]